MTRKVYFGISLRSTLLGLVVFAACTLGISAQESPTKITNLLDHSGYKYVAKSSTIWAVDFTGKALTSFKVIFAVQEDLLVTFVIVSHKKDLDMTPVFMQRLLKFNHHFDQVKVGIDDDGDLFVRTDMSVRILDDKAFKDETEQVAAAANEVYAAIKSQLKQ